ncbi:MAG: hypothetical protein KAZ14_02045 [Nitrosomonas sp.]|nr:hypothetical protein [Nitrosomonas sp.]
MRIVAKLKLYLLLVIPFLLASCGDSSYINKPKIPVRIVVFGDSVSQGYGFNIFGEPFHQITPGNTYTELLLKKLISEGYDEFAPITVINTSLGGEFAVDAVYRLPTVLHEFKPTHVLLAHGTNDSVSLIPNDFIAEDFEKMILLTKNSGAIPFVIDIPPALFGIEYGMSYTAMMKSVAAKTGAIYINLLKNIYNDSKYYRDEFHPNDLAQPIMMENVFFELEKTFK